MDWHVSGVDDISDDSRLYPLHFGQHLTHQRVGVPVFPHRTEYAQYPHRVLPLSSPSGVGGRVHSPFFTITHIMASKAICRRRVRSRVYGSPVTSLRRTLAGCTVEKA